MLIVLSHRIDVYSQPPKQCIHAIVIVLLQQNDLACSIVWISQLDEVVGR